MMGPSKQFRAKAAGILGCVVLGVTASAALGQGASPFTTLAGSWSGNGTIAMSDGHNEKIRCKATYEVTPSGIILHQELRCASDSYKFEVKSSLQADNGVISGTWTEVTRQVTGDVVGSIRGDQISTSVKGTGFSAKLGVTTRGNAQSVSIKPEGTDIQSVQIDLKRS